MKNVLLLNLHQRYEGFAEGNLAQTIVNEAKQFFESNGFQTDETVIENGYTTKEELEKFKTCDLFFVHSPVYWIGLPWSGKKYINEVLSAGNGTITFINDG